MNKNLILIVLLIFLELYFIYILLYIFHLFHLEYMHVFHQNLLKIDKMNEHSLLFSNFGNSIQKYSSFFGILFIIKFCIGKYDIFFHIQIHLHLQLYHKNLLNFLLFFLIIVLELLFPFILLLFSFGINICELFCCF